ncbi:hypothetical protein H4582DRAFT_2005596 [Lactarius indigo]|nr:hypothetical protein H4582DRAFT_2005596 [Lactarius indigo]
MSPFASPSPFMSNRRPKPSPPLTHERGGAQEWHPPFARNGGATGTPPLPLFTCEQDTRMRDKPPPPLPFARKEEAQERGHATRDGVGKARALPPLLAGDPRALPEAAPRPPLVCAQRRRAVRERGGALQPGVAPLSLGSCARADGRTGERARAKREGGGRGRETPLPRARAQGRDAKEWPRGAPPSPGCGRTGPPPPFRVHAPGQNREGAAVRDIPLPGLRARAKTRRGGRAGRPPSSPGGSRTPPGSHQDKNANRRPRGGPPLPRSARKGET